MNDPTLSRRRDAARARVGSGHRRLHAHLLVVGAHVGTFASYNAVLAVVREPSPGRYLFWGTGVGLHAAYVWARARAGAHAGPR